MCVNRIQKHQNAYILGSSGPFSGAYSLFDAYFLWLDAYPSFGVIQKNSRGGGRKYTFLTIIQMLNLYFRTCTIGLRKKSGAICSGHIITECHSGLILHKSSFMHAWYVIKAKFAHISILYIPGYLRYTTPKSSWKKIGICTDQHFLHRPPPLLRSRHGPVR